MYRRVAQQSVEQQTSGCIIPTDNIWSHNPMPYPTIPDCICCARKYITRHNLAVRGPRRVRLRPGLHGRALLPRRPLRPDVRERGQLRAPGHLRLRRWLVRAQLHRPRVLPDLRQRRELHRAGGLRVRVGVVGRGRGRGGGGGRRTGRGGGRLPRSGLRCAVPERRVVRRAGDLRVPAAMDRSRLCHAGVHAGEHDLRGGCECDGGAWGLRDRRITWP